MTVPLLTDTPEDLRLLERLRPEGWRNPGKRNRYHLVVLGGGTAGLVTAAIAAGLGARTALVERGLMGGDCLNYGCVPSKALLAAARAWRAAAEAGELGGPAISGGGDFAAVMARMRGIRADISAHDSPERFRGLGVDVWLGEGRFTAADRLEVDGRELRFRRAVVATGTRPHLPRIQGLATAAPLTNETVFSLTTLPPRFGIIGGGAIGTELAQAFQRLGSQVTLLESAPRLLPMEDPDASALLHAALENEGVTVRTGARITAVAREGGVTRITAESPGGGTVPPLEVDELLVACGRDPNVSDLGLDRAGVRFDSSRGIEVDERLRTSNPKIYAAGDVAGPFRHTHVADAHARLVVRNALFFGRGRTDRLVIPWCTYTDPEVAHVGIPFPDLVNRSAELDVQTISLESVDRARLDGAGQGFLRVHLSRGTDRIVAATLVGPHAGEIVSLIGVAMHSGLGLGKLGEAIYPYPTYAEAVRKAADAWRRGKLTPVARTAFGAYFRLLKKG